jgi:signal transduction histidine kinase
MDKIKESNLGSRLDEGEQKDELSQLKMQFNQMLDRLEEAFENQKAFVSHASHELRTPLTSITGQIQVSLLAKDSPEELQAMIESVLEDVQQLNKLANNLLDLTSINSNSSKFKVNLINMLELVFQVRGDLLAKSPNSKIIIHHEENDENPPEIRGVESLLLIAIHNLMDNGIKYADNSELEVNIEDINNELLICFENTGQTMTRDEMAVIFEPFKRGANAHKIKGHGIGLPLTKKIIELHKGTITLSTEFNRKTSFTLKLPKHI